MIRLQQFNEVLADAAQQCDGELIPVPLEEYRRAVETDRIEDRRLLESGELTPEELMDRNSCLKGPFVILDLSPIYR